MGFSYGFTAEEIRNYVAEYQLVPYGKKQAWLETMPVSYTTLGRWRTAVYSGDVERGLVPRESGFMTVPQPKRTALEKARLAEQEAAAAEIARLNARVKQLEDSNDVLGKAIGLLHAMRGEEPETSRRPSTPSDS